MADFYSFKEVADYFKKSNDRLVNAEKEALKASGKYLRDAVRGRHGVKQPGRPAGSNPTPLLRTGKLRDSVEYKIKGKDTARIFTKMERLAIIHEYGITYRMTEKQRKYLF